MALVTNNDGNTPLSPEELADLIPSLATKEDLNEWERENIINAREWAAKDRTTAIDVVSDAYIRKLHEKMFEPDMEMGGAVPEHREEHWRPFS